MLFRGLASAALLAGVFASVTDVRGVAPAGPILFAADHRPALDGEIYRVDLNGKRLDLSRSPFEDTQLHVSPNGRRVAFVSERGHGTRIYVVGIDGHGLRTVSSALPTVEEPELGGWSPNGTRLAATAGTVEQTRVYVLQPGRPQRVVARVPSASASIGEASWSADGRALAFPIFIFGPPNPVPRVRVVDDRGETRATFRADAFAWSPEGERMASIEKRQLTVRDGAGLGPVILRLSSIAATGLFWVDANRLVLFKTDPLGGPPTRVGIEVPSGRSWKPSARLVSAHLCGCASPDGSRIVETAKVVGGFAVRVERADGSGAQTLLEVPGCMDDSASAAAVTSLQFAAAGRLVYQSSCPEPQLDLYAIDVNGSDLRALTRTRAEETEPVRSPDGTRIAYVRAEARGFSCKGCPSTLWVMNADGTNQHALTQPTDGQWDSQPSWSPDGTQLVFSRSFLDRGPELFVVSAAGGAARDLKVAGSAPAWGPSSIAYAAKGGLAHVAPDGTGAHLVARAVNPLAAWSPAGTLAYVDQRQGRDAVLVVGGRRAQLTFPSVDSLSWTADGKRLVLFAADASAGSLGNVPFDVYTVRPDGSGIRRLTTDVSGWPGG